LVNEAYVRLIGWKDVHWKNRAHFLGVAAQMMRRILVDYARRASVRRGARVLQVSLDEAAAVSSDDLSMVIAVDEALQQLAAISPRKSQIVELRFFGGMTVEETAVVLKLAPVTVHREWNVAKAWLMREISSRGGSGPEAGSADTPQ
jgi:RNA polymerase sigma factor (TIGR02999 family)